MQQVRLAVLCVTALSSFLFFGVAAGGIVGPCESSWQLHASAEPVALVACPQGDTESFTNQGWWISIFVADFLGQAVPDVPGADLWLIDCDPTNDLVLCGGSTSSNADASTDNHGMTTMANGTLAASGCADGIAVVVQGVVLMDPPGCTSVKCAPIYVRSADIDGSLKVGLPDLAMLATHMPPAAYEKCYDFNIDGIIDLQDFSIFAPHYTHSCN